MQIKIKYLTKVRFSWIQKIVYKGKVAFHSIFLFWVIQQVKGKSLNESNSKRATQRGSNRFQRELIVQKVGLLRMFNFIILYPLTSQAAYAAPLLRVPECPGDPPAGTIGVVHGCNKIQVTLSNVGLNNKYIYIHYVKMYIHIVSFLLQNLQYIWCWKRLCNMDGELVMRKE